MTHKELYELYILNLLSLGYVSIRLLCLEEESFRRQWNDFSTDLLGWQKSRVLDSIQNLLSSNQIGLHDEDWREVCEQFKPSDPKVLSQLVSIRNLGISRWIKYFKPDWDLFYMAKYYESMRDPLNENVVIIAGSRQRRDELFANCIKYRNFDFRFGMQGVRKGRISDWRVASWKKLKFGYYFRARLRHVELKGFEGFDLPMTTWPEGNPFEHQWLTLPYKQTK